MATTFTFKQAIEAVGVSKPTVLSWIRENKVKAKKNKTPFTPQGFTYEFSASEVEKMKALKRPKGRPSAQVQDEHQ